MSGTFAIIQARMGSTRLPGKVLMDIGGVPMLSRVVERCRCAETLTGIVVATSTQPADDEVAALAKANGWPCVRGSEADVLDRYHDAAAQVRANIIVRVTADCPLLDPSVIDRVVRALRASGSDYASNILPPRTYPRGLDVEAFTRSALERAWSEATGSAEREHVTPFIWRQPELFRLTRVASSEDHSNLRWTVDTEADLELVRRIYGELSGPTQGLDAVLHVLERHPDWSLLNADVEQKELT